MIDFPASPTDGQIFGAPNGVVYRYNATYTSWLAQNAAPAIGGTGDFCATLTTGNLPTSVTTLIPTTIISGNAGLWYSVSTGRWTPPAGRYVIFGSISVFNAATASNINGFLRKNGTNIAPLTGDAAAVVNQHSDLFMQFTVDANGSDYFDIQAASGSAGSAINVVTFGGYPLTGLQGPTGGAPGPVVGDFCAINNAAITYATSMATVVLPTIRSGNSGAYYNTTTGRFTPPAGRYFLIATASAIHTSLVIALSISIAKNGAGVALANATPAVASYGFATVDATVDANGSDYFEFQAYSTSSGTTSNVAGNVSFTAFPTQGMVGPQGPIGPAGVTQTVFFETGALATGTTLIPNDDTIPQQTEGDQYMSLAITPQSATSRLVIDVVWNGSCNVVSAMVLALFQDSTANALAVVSTTLTAINYQMQMKLTHSMTSGTTSATTFKVRVGGNIAGTTTINGAGGARLFGGAMASSIVIREVP